nr:class I SAM-dependent methyltransferase [Limnobacter litoralis]
MSLEDGKELLWLSEKQAPSPQRIQAVDDTCTADQAFRMASQGTSLLWQGDFQNARQLLQAVVRRLTAKAKPIAADAFDFNRHRMNQAQRANILSRLLVPVEPDFSIPLRRAPDCQQAIVEAFGFQPVSLPGVIPLRDLQGLIGAHEWRKKGVQIPALAQLGTGRIHPHYGVFSPVRGEYLDMVAKAPLPAALSEQSVAFDLGTGTGVLAAILVARGVEQVFASDSAPRALACAKDNLKRLGIQDKVQICADTLFPEGQAALVVCNPPWVPAKPVSTVEQGVYDEGSQMLRAFLAGVADRLLPNGEAWLILSDIAEHLQLRTRPELNSWIEAGGLSVIERMDRRPTHAKATDESDPLHAARAREITSLWRLKRKTA